ncbi:MAG: LysR family transcriptional regulator [Eubacteriales bacterium]
MINKMANFEHYKVFYKIAQCGSISKAAEALFVSQPAVSLAIRQLENQTGVKLFFRTQKGVNLTVEGEILYEYIQQGCRAFQAGEDKIKEILGLQAGEVRVGTSDITLRFFILPFIERFRKEYNQINVKIRNHSNAETLNNLREGTIDFGIICEPFNYDSDLRIRPVKEIQDVLVASPRFEELRGKQLTPAMLRDYPFIMMVKNSSTRSHIDKYIMDNSTDIKPEIELDSIDMMIEFTKKGLGLSFIVEELVRAVIARGELFQVDLSPVVPSRKFYLVSLAGVPQSPAAIKMLQMI